MLECTSSRVDVIETKHHAMNGFPMEVRSYFMMKGTECNTSEDLGCLEGNEGVPEEALSFTCNLVFTVHHSRRL